MATFEKRGSAWRVRVRKGGISKTDTFRTKREAEAWALSLETEIAAGKIGKTVDRSFGELLQRYADEITPTKRGARSEALRIGRVLRDEIAHVRLPNFDAPDIAAWRDRRLKEVGVASVLREWNILSHACNVAIKEWRWLHDNPFGRVQRPDAPAPRKRRPTQAELDAILLALGYAPDAELDTQTARVGASALFAIETAMRASEICGLTRENVSGRTAHLPKTKNGHARDVPLSREALRILDQLGPELFAITPANLDALWRKGCARAMVEDLHFHDLRREALTRLSQKLSVMELAKVSGHKDLRILQAVYFSPSADDLASKLD